MPTQPTPSLISSPTSPGVIVGSVAASATTGALIAMGHRLGSATIPFASISAAILRRTATASSGGLVLTGFVLHVTIAFLWSFVFVWLVRRVRISDVVAAIITALGELVVSGVIASLAGAGMATVIPLGDRVVLAVVYALALVVGMRFAFPALRNA